MNKILKIFPVSSMFSGNLFKVIVGVIAYALAYPLVCAILTVINIALMWTIIVPILMHIVGWVWLIYCVVGVVLLIVKYVQRNKAEAVEEVVAEEVAEEAAEEPAAEEAVAEEVAAEEPAAEEVAAETEEA